MLNVAIYGMGNWGARLIESVQGKSDKMKRRILAGEIGDLVHIEGHHSGPTGFNLKPGYWRSTRAESPAGGMSPRGIHTLDAMINLGGLICEVYAHSERRKLQPPIDMDDTTSMLLRFKNGITGYFATLFITGDLYRVHAFGTKGWLELRGDTELLARGLAGNPQPITLPVIDKERAELEAFADAVAARQPYLVPPEQAVNGIAVIEAIVASEGTGNVIKIE